MLAKTSRSYYLTYQSSRPIRLCRAFALTDPLARTLRSPRFRNSIVGFSVRILVALRVAIGIRLRSTQMAFSPAPFLHQLHDVLVSPETQRFARAGTLGKVALRYFSLDRKWRLPCDDGRFQERDDRGQAELFTGGAGFRESDLGHAEVYTSPPARSTPETATVRYIATAAIPCR